MSDDSVKWGIIGCGDVCEIKSAPAFNKVRNSRLVAVMRRDMEKSKDFAKRHNVPEFYNDAEKIFGHKDINAVYIATPPAYHEEYAVEAMKAGKMVYIEKPIALTSEACKRMIKARDQYNSKVSGAYYRRALPMFIKVKSLLEEESIGKIRLVSIRLFQPLNNNLIARSENNWRVKPDISGGGLFHDLAPHQLDLIYWFFGVPNHMFGSSMNQTRFYNAPDITSFEAVFKNKVLLQGMWFFNANNDISTDKCEIYGEKGKIEFSFFRNPVLRMIINGKTEDIEFSHPENIQLPMIEKVTGFFRSENENPCSLEDTLVSMKMLDSTII